MKRKIHLFPTLVLWFCICSLLPIKGEAVTSSLHGDDKTTYTFTLLKATGEPQTDVFVKIKYESSKYAADSNGVITFERNKKSYNKTAEFYFNHQTKQSVKTLLLNQEQAEQTFYLDSQEDIQNYKRTNQLFPIEGIVKDTDGEPVEGATISIQGTGRVTYTDEIGLFKIEADFNHPVVIRADGMTNQSFPIQHFFTPEEEGTLVVMQAKGQQKVYSSVEKMPSFPGGMKAYREYLDHHLEYPKKAKEAQIEGVVVVQFIVEKEGEISNARVVRHLEASLDSAAVRAIREMPSWIPASDYGNAVRCKYSLPVSFKIPKPVLAQKDSITTNNARLAMDSLKVNSLPLRTKLDSIPLDSTLLDSMTIDSVKVKAQQIQSIADSLKNVNLKNEQLLSDSTSVNREVQAEVKKRPKGFVRFFRKLFGIERKERKRNSLSIK